MLLASQSDAHRIAPHRDPIQPNPRPRPIPLIALKQERPMMWYIFEKEIVQGPQKQCCQVKNKNLENLENQENQEKQRKPKKPKKPKKPQKKPKKKPKKKTKKKQKNKETQKPKN